MFHSGMWRQSHPMLICELNYMGLFPWIPVTYRLFSALFSITLAFLKEIVVIIDIAFLRITLRSQAQSYKVRREMIQPAPYHGRDNKPFRRIIQVHVHSFPIFAKFYVATSMHSDKEFCAGSVCMPATFRAFGYLIYPKYPFAAKWQTVFCCCIFQKGQTSALVDKGRNGNCLYFQGFCGLKFIIVCSI